MPLCTVPAYGTSGLSARCASLIATRCTCCASERVERTGSARSTGRAACARRADCPAASRRRSARRCRRDRARRRTRRPAGTTRACGTRRTRGCRARCGSGGSVHRRDQLGLRARAAAREQRDVVPGVDEAVGEQRDDELDAAVSGRRDREPHGGDDRDTHAGSCGRLEPAAGERLRVLRDARAVDDEREREPRRGRRHRHARRGLGVLHLEPLGRDRSRPPARPVLPRHALPLRAAPAR